MACCRAPRFFFKSKLLVFLLCAAGFAVYYPFNELDERLCACAKCLSEDERLFLDTANSSFQPFLTSDLMLSKHVFRWWKGLQNEKRSFGAYETTVKTIFKIFPRNPDVIRRGSDRCITCAVVGNSANLRGSRYGPLIDSHEIVIRVNRGITRGFERDVGTRTTHRAMYPESSVDLDDNTHLVLFPFKVQDFVWLMKAFTVGFKGRSYGPIKPKIKANKDLVMVVNPAFMMYVHEFWLKKKGNYPSTGFMTLILSLHICDEVDVFGYGADSDGNWSHYYERLEDKTLKTGVHPGNVEYAIIQWLAQQQKIRFYRGVMKTKGSNVERGRRG